MKGGVLTTIGGLLILWVVGALCLSAVTGIPWHP